MDSTFSARGMNKQKEATCERGERDDRRTWGESKAYSATDGDSVAAWVEPSEGVSVLCVCVCGEHLATMTTLQAGRSQKK